MSNSNRLIEALTVLLAMSQSHVEDIESGLEEGLYDEKDNADLVSKKSAIAEIEQHVEALRNKREKSHVCEAIVTDMVAMYGEAVTNDEEINGADAVEQLVEWVVQAQAV